MSSLCDDKDFNIFDRVTEKQNMLIMEQGTKYVISIKYHPRIYSRSIYLCLQRCLIILCFTWILCLIFEIEVQAHLSCPDWIKNRKNMPLCPEEGQSSILPETFPTGAIVVSSQSALEEGFLGIGDRSGQVSQQFTASFVEQVVRSVQDDKTRIPLFFLMGISENTRIEIRDRINNLNIPRERKAEFLSSLRLVSAPSYTWQQNHFKTFAMPTGQILFRDIQYYAEERGNKDSFLSKEVYLRDCGFQKGEDLPVVIDQWWDELKEGYFGGNIGALPGGFCLLGSDDFNDREWEEYAKVFCGWSRSNRIKVPTDWLKVGHTDEVISVLKNNNPSGRLCAFSIAIASPRKALEILSQNLEAPFTSLRNKDHYMLQLICEEALEREEKEQEQQRNHRASQGISKLMDLLMPLSYAQSSQFFRRLFRSRVRTCRNNDKNLTNGDVVKLLQGDSPLAMYNGSVQEEMDVLQRLLTEKVTSRLGCTPDFIQSPSLFYSDVDDLIVEKNEYGYRYLGIARKSGFSVLPNSISGVYVGNSVILSDTGGNQAFSEYIKTEYEKRGITPRFVDSSLYAHVGGGHLHSATHSIHICRPRQGTQRGSTR